MSDYRVCLVSAPYCFIKNVRRITDRIRNPTPEKVGSIWNYMGREKTSEFVFTIKRGRPQKSFQIHLCEIFVNPVFSVVKSHWPPACAG